MRATWMLIHMSASCWRSSGSSFGPRWRSSSISRATPNDGPARGAAADGGPFVHQRGQGDTPPAVDVARGDGRRAPPTSVKNTSLNDAPPVIWRSGRTSTPGACMSTTKPVRPLCLGTFGSVRQMISPMSLNWAPEVHTFWPLTTHSSPSRSALVWRLARSLPAPRLAEQLAGDDVAPVQRPQVALLHRLGAVGQDGRRHHAEPDAEHGARGHLVAGLERLPAPLVGRRQLPPAVSGGPGDPAEAGVEHLAAPRLGLRHLGQLLLPGLLLEQPDPVRALAPRPPAGPPCGVRVAFQERRRLLFELLRAPWSPRLTIPSRLGPRSASAGSVSASDPPPSPPAPCASPSGRFTSG